MYKLQLAQTSFTRVERGENLKMFAKRVGIPEVVLIFDNNLKGQVSHGDLLITKNYNLQIYTAGHLESVGSICKKFKMTRGEFCLINRTEYVFAHMNVFVKNRL